MVKEMEIKGAGAVMGGEPWAYVSGDPYARQAASSLHGYGQANEKYATPVRGSSPISYGCAVAIAAAAVTSGKAYAETRQGNQNAGFTVAQAGTAWLATFKLCP